MPTAKDGFLIDSEARAWTLPSHVYTDAAAFAAEQERTFRRSWQVVGHRDQVANSGDYFTTEPVGEPLLIDRDNDRKLRGFLTCAGTAPVRPRKVAGRENCFAAAITYGLDGALRGATEIEGVERFRREEFALAPARVEEWFNLIFVNLDGGARPLRESLGELPNQAGKFDFGGMKLLERRRYDMSCNWKTYVDNYLEGYHLPSVHPGLNRELDFNSYVVEPHAEYVRQFSPIRGAQPGVRFRGATRKRARTLRPIISGSFRTGC